MLPLMSIAADTPITQLVAEARSGGERERDVLYTAIYDELKAIARCAAHVGRVGDTLQPTVLVSEVFLELERRFPPPPKEMEESRATFYRSVALAMRTIIRDAWRAKRAGKRGGGESPAPLAGEVPVVEEDGFGGLDFLALDESLERLERFNARWYDVVMHRYFAGRTIRETAALVGVAPSTVIADWKLAQSWLAQDMARSKG